MMGLTLQGQHIGSESYPKRGILKMTSNEHHSTMYKTEVHLNIHILNVMLNQDFTEISPNLLNSIFQHDIGSKR